MVTAVAEDATRWGWRPVQPLGLPAGRAKQGKAGLPAALAPARSLGMHSLLYCRLKTLSSSAVASRHLSLKWLRGSWCLGIECPLPGRGSAGKEGAENTSAGERAGGGAGRALEKLNTHFTLCIQQLAPACASWGRPSRDAAYFSGAVGAPRPCFRAAARACGPQGCCFPVAVSAPGVIPFLARSAARLLGRTRERTDAVCKSIAHVCAVKPDACLAIFAEQSFDALRRL